MPVVSMSKKELNRLAVLLGIRSAHLRGADACELLGVTGRQGVVSWWVRSPAARPALSRSDVVDRARIVWLRRIAISSIR
jgi:hypothetical protein